MVQFIDINYKARNCLGEGKKVWIWPWGATETPVLPTARPRNKSTEERKQQLPQRFPVTHWPQGTASLVSGPKVKATFLEEVKFLQDSAADSEFYKCSGDVFRVGSNSGGSDSGMQRTVCGWESGCWEMTSQSWAFWRNYEGRIKHETGNIPQNKSGRSYKIVWEGRFTGQMWLT